MSTPWCFPTSQRAPPMDDHDVDNEDVITSFDQRFAAKRAAACEIRPATIQDENISHSRLDGPMIGHLPSEHNHRIVSSKHGFASSKTLSETASIHSPKPDMAETLSSPSSSSSTDSDNTFRVESDVRGYVASTPPSPTGIGEYQYRPGSSFRNPVEPRQTPDIASLEPASPVSARVLKSQKRSLTVASRRAFDDLLFSGGSSVEELAALRLESLRNGIRRTDERHAANGKIFHEANDAVVNTHALNNSLLDLGRSAWQPSTMQDSNHADRPSTVTAQAVLPTFTESFDDCQTETTVVSKLSTCPIALAKASTTSHTTPFDQTTSFPAIIDTRVLAIADDVESPIRLESVPFGISMTSEKGPPKSQDPLPSPQSTIGSARVLPVVDKVEKPERVEMTPNETQTIPVETRVKFQEAVSEPIPAPTSSPIFTPTKPLMNSSSALASIFANIGRRAVESKAADLISKTVPADTAVPIHSTQDRGLWKVSPGSGTLDAAVPAVAASTRRPHDVPDEGASVKRPQRGTGPPVAPVITRPTSSVPREPMSDASNCSKVASRAIAGLRARNAPFAQEQATRINSDAYGQQLERDDLRPQPRRVFLENLPPDATLQQVCDIIWRGCLEKLLLNDAGGRASVTFASSEACANYSDDTANGILWPADPSRLIWVIPDPEVKPLSSSLKTCMRSGITRIVRATGTSAGDLTEKHIRNIAALGGGNKHPRVVTSVEISELRGLPFAEFAMATIQEAVMLAGHLRRSPEWEGCHIVYRPDPCAAATCVRIPT